MSLKSIIIPSNIRQFPTDPLPEKALSLIDLTIGERGSFQLAYRSDDSSSYDLVRVRASVDLPKGWTARIRREGLVPVPNYNQPFEQNLADNDCWGKIPGMVPDPLFDDDSDTLRPAQKQAFWFTITPPPDSKPGKYDIVVRLQAFNRDFSKPLCRPHVRHLACRIHNLKIRPRKNFSITHWFYADCLIAFYKTKLFDDRFWSIAESYFKNIAEHGQDVLYVPLFTPALDHDKIPSQLLKIKKTPKGIYHFDWSDVQRYIDLARKSGIQRFEWCHLASQANARFAIRIYEGQGATEKLLWPKDTLSSSPIYRNFLSALLPEWKDFLDKNNLLNSSFFHICDEPNGNEARSNYRALHATILEYAPWFKSLDALSDISFAREKLTDTPVPLLPHVRNFLNEGFPTWCYYCGGPRLKYLNHLIDTPLPKVALHGFVLYHWPVKGFLHWGLNYWNVFGTRILSDPFSSLNGRDGNGNVPDAAHGDMFLLYPGPNGPIDSIRWELLGEAFQDYALLQTLGIDRESKIFDEIRAFDDLPTDPEWRARTRATLLRKY